MNVSSASESASIPPRLALDPAGDAVAAWYSLSGTNYIVRAASRPAGGSFGAPVSLSATGQNADEPQVAIDPAGDAVAVWRRSNGTNYIIQAASRPAGGSFGAPVDLSLAGQSAAVPQVAFDPGDNALVVWSSFNGTNNVVQAASRPVGGSFGAPADVSPSGQDSEYPEVALDQAGDAVLVWMGKVGTGSYIAQATTRPAGGSFGTQLDLSTSGANLPVLAVDPGGDAVSAWQNVNSVPNHLVQAAIYRVGFPRPKGATPMPAALVPAYQPCVSPNETHGAPLSHGSCAPPAQASSFLTVGTADANGAGAIGSVVYTTLVNTAATPNDVLITVSTTDVRRQPAESACGSANAADGPDYTGQLQATAGVRITDKLNAAGTNEAGTVSDTSFPVTVPCAPTASTSIGSICSVSTSANAVIPGSLTTGARAIWELGQVKVYDGGARGVAGSSDATLFEGEGIFMP